MKHQQVCDRLFGTPAVTCNTPVELCFSFPLIRATVPCRSRPVCGIFHWREIKTGLSRFKISIATGSTIKTSFKSSTNQSQWKVKYHPQPSIFIIIFLHHYICCSCPLFSFDLRGSWKTRKGEMYSWKKEGMWRKGNKLKSSVHASLKIIQKDMQCTWSSVPPITVLATGSRPEQYLVYSNHCTSSFNALSDK